MQYGTAPKLIIPDNNMYGTIGMHHEMRYPGRPYHEATKLTNPDFALWARWFVAEGITIREPGEVAAGMAKAISINDRPVGVHGHTSADQMSPWRRPARPS